MKKTDDLLLLIKSLSKSEKRYFKINASRHSIGGKNTYVKLFDAIDKMEEYDEEAIKEQFRGEKFVSNLFSTKNYLFNILLKSLTEFHSTGSTRHEANRIIDEFLILMEKGMFKHAEKKLKQAKEVMLKNEMFELVLDVLRLEMTLFNRINYTSKVRELYSVNKKEKSEISAKLNVFNELNYIYNIITNIWQKDKLPDSDDRKWINRYITKNSLFRSEENALSDKGKMLYFRILYIAHEIIFDEEKSYFYLKKITGHFESKPKLIENYTGHYLQSLTNLISLEIHLTKFSDADKSIEKLKKLPDKLPAAKSNKYMQASILFHTYHLSLLICINTAQLERGLKMIDETIVILKEYGGHILKYRVMELYFFFSCLYFLDKNYVSTLNWLNKILNEDSEISPDIFSFSRILRLMTLYEKKEFDLIDYYLKPTKRYLTKKERIFKYEELILRFFSNIINITDENDAQSLFVKFKSNLMSLTEIPYEWNAVGNLNLIEWIDSKITNRSVADILRERTRVQNTRN